MVRHPVTEAIVELVSAHVDLEQANLRKRQNAGPGFAAAVEQAAARYAFAVRNLDEKVKAIA